MERIVSCKYSELIGAAFDIIPATIVDRLGYIHFLTGTDPIYVGLKREECPNDGRSFRTTWCCSYPWNQFVEDKRVTVVMPQLYKGYPMKLLPMLVVHELAHVLDYILGFNHVVKPITEYGRTNRMEAFADSFVYWLFPEYEDYYEITKPIGDETIYLFEQLAGMA